MEQNNILIHPYKTSKDYQRLWELMQKHRVVCFVRPYLKDGNPEIVDVCATPRIFNPNGYNTIGCRGMAYLSVWGDGSDREIEFFGACKLYDLEFIDPEGGAANV